MQRDLLGNCSLCVVLRWHVQKLFRIEMTTEYPVTSLPFVVIIVHVLCWVVLFACSSCAPAGIVFIIVSLTAYSYTCMRALWRVHRHWVCYHCSMFCWIYKWYHFTSMIGLPPVVLQNQPLRSIFLLFSYWTAAVSSFVYFVLPAHFFCGFTDSTSAVFTFYKQYTQF